jgi:hypothetical protein
MPLFRTRFSFWLVFFGSILACSEEKEEASTFRIVQKRIFETSCTEGCHTAGTSFASQSGLILDGKQVFDQLVNADPKNTAAKADGLKRVSNTGGTAALEASFLWKKIDTGHDHDDEHPDYGALMPLGKPVLTNGELEFIRQWIVAGAPENGIVANETLFDDTTRASESKVFVPLEAPASGVQLKLGPFPVSANFEREFNYFEPNPNTDTVYISRVEISMRPGSHHFILYQMAENTPVSVFPQSRVYRDIRNPDGSMNINHMLQMSYHVFFAGTQWSMMNDAFPAGVALEWPAGKGLDLNAHYVNRSDTATTGEVHINLHTIPKSQVQHTARILNISNQSFTLPPLQTTTLTHTQTFNRQVRVFKLFTHAHQLMKTFQIKVVGGPRNGEIVYETNDWEHPPILTLDPPLTLNAGQGLQLIATYTNWKTVTVRFGLTSEDEMMILFGYYY